MKRVHEFVMPEKDAPRHVLDFGPVPKLPERLMRERHCFNVFVKIIQQSFHAQERLDFRLPEINAHRNRRGLGRNDLLESLQRLSLAVLQVKSDCKAEKRVGASGRKRKRLAEFIGGVFRSFALLRIFPHPRSACAAICGNAASQCGISSVVLYHSRASASFPDKIRIRYFHAHYRIGSVLSVFFQ